MKKKSRNQEILENIKKNDPRFKDLEIVKSCLDFPPYEQFLKDIEYIKSDLKNCETYEQKIRKIKWLLQIIELNELRKICRMNIRKPNDNEKII